MEEVEVILILVEDIDNNLLLRPAHHVIVLAALREVYLSAEEAFSLSIPLGHTCLLYTSDAADEE